MSFGGTKPRLSGAMKAVLSLGLLLLAACAPAASERALSVAAAASLREVVLDAAGAFHAQRGGAAPVLVFEASSTLARQIGEGATVDVFLSADRENVVRAGARVRPDAAAVFLANELVLAVRADDRDAPRDLAPFAEAGLALGLAGEAVPAGRYARNYLQSLGLLGRFDGRVAIGNNVRATLALLESGAVRGAFVYRTDAVAAGPGIEIAHVAPRAAAPVVYLAAAVESGPGNELHPDAGAFLAYLGSPKFLAVAEARGFAAPEQRP